MLRVGKTKLRHEVTRVAVASRAYEGRASMRPVTPPLLTKIYNLDMAQMRKTCVPNDDLDKQAYLNTF